MALSLVELSKTITDPVAAGVIEHLITVDQVVPFLPFVGIDSDHVNFVREKALPTTLTPTPGATITVDDDLAFSRVTQYVRTFLIDQNVNNLNAVGTGGIAMAKSKATLAAAKSLGRKMGNDLFLGNSTWTVTINAFGSIGGATTPTITVGPNHDPRMPNGVVRYTHSGTTVRYKAPGDADFGAAVSYATGVKVYSSSEDKWVTVTIPGTLSSSGDITFSFAATGSSTPIEGLIRLVAPAQTISAVGTNGDAIAFAAIDQLLDQVTDTSGPKVLMMHRRTWRSIKSLLRAAGGATMGEFMGRKVPEYEGVPILLSDWIPTNRTTGGTTTTGVVFAATLGEEGGLCGLYSKTMAADERNATVIGTPVNGLTVLDLGTNESSDAQKVRVRAYWGVKNASEKGLAMLDGITN